MLNKGVVRKKQIVVGLLRIGLLRTFCNHDTPSEDAPGLLTQNPFIEFPAGTVGLRMLDSRVIVNVLVA